MQFFAKFSLMFFFSRPITSRDEGAMMEKHLFLPGPDPTSHTHNQNQEFAGYEPRDLQNKIFAQLLPPPPPLTISYPMQQQIKKLLLRSQNA